MALLLGVDRFMSEARAITNPIGNAVGTMAIARWVGAVDRERMVHMLDGTTDPRDRSVLRSRRHRKSRSPRRLALTARAAGLSSGFKGDRREGRRHAPLLRAMFDAAIAAAQPALCVPPHLPPRPGRLIVIGAGKASAAMARAVEDNWQGRWRAWSSRATATPCRASASRSSRPRIPVPDAAGEQAARAHSASWSGADAPTTSCCA